MTRQPYFLNQALQISFRHPPEDLIRLCLETENKLGRIRTEKYGPRTIDIDILYFHNKIISNRHLIIPHPRLHQRRFVLAPMVEIAPMFIHPLLKQTQEKLLENCQDPLPVRKLNLC